MDRLADEMMATKICETFVPSEERATPGWSGATQAVRMCNTFTDC